MVENIVSSISCEDYEPWRGDREPLAELIGDDDDIVAGAPFMLAECDLLSQEEGRF